MESGALHAGATPRLVGAMHACRWPAPCMNATGTGAGCSSGLLTTSSPGQLCVARSARPAYF